MTPTVVAATVERSGRGRRDQLRVPNNNADVMVACSFAARIQTPRALTPCADICEIRTPEPDRSILDPVHQMPGPNS